MPKRGKNERARDLKNEGDKGGWNIHPIVPAVNAVVPYQLLTPPLDTPWTKEVGTNPWPQHPRPRLVREDWEVLIPSCIESGISGIMANRSDIKYMWFGTNFTLPSSWNKDNRVILIFEAVDYEATVFVNGKRVGFNRGGYFRFSLDVTDVPNSKGSNDLQVFVFDPTDAKGYAIPHGKRTLNPSHIFYTPCSGIWQSIWLERVPIDHVTELDITPGMNGDVLLTHKFWSNQPVTFNFASPKLWTPDTPHLYNISLKMGHDTVRSYTGFRTIETGVVKGIKGPLLNGKFVFRYWPDGIHTPPTLEAMVWDLQEYPKFHIAENIRLADPTKLINAVTGWHDNGAGDFHDNHHYADPQCGPPWSSILSTPYDPKRIGFHGKYGGLGHVLAQENLWPVQAAVYAINQTYEINADLPAYHYRAHVLFNLLKDQVADHACSGAVCTQTTDVEGEVNGLATYDRRIIRID
ncbi:galactose-binding domain-like protein [Apodospora peruviana]|uniref:Galactose-binding domain-like protein n=1 Tax=Apodospora peruviana TaxID=516989 RepID=A0AAE0M078_9PEZI|nr:galactose-binding domain-like protein [Apodospora peruviana]